MLILSIDLGKYNSIACFFDSTSQKPVFTNTPMRQTMLVNIDITNGALEAFTLQTKRRPNRFTAPKD